VGVTFHNASITKGKYMKFENKLFLSLSVITGLMTLSAVGLGVLLGEAFK